VHWNEEEAAEGINNAFSPVPGIQSGRMALKRVAQRRDGVPHDPNMTAHSRSSYLEFKSKQFTPGHHDLLNQAHDTSA
jgi:hypothetical protein